MDRFGVWAEHVVQWWTLRRRLVDPTVRNPYVVPLRRVDGTPTGVVAELDPYRSTTHTIDMLRAEPLDRKPTQRELDELADLRRESTRRSEQDTSPIIHGTHEDSGVLSASAPVPRERF